MNVNSIDDIQDVQKQIMSIDIQKIMIIVIIIAVSVAIMMLLLFLSGHFYKKWAKKSNGIHIKFLGSVTKALIFLLEVMFILSLFDLTKDLSKTILGGSAVILTIVSFASQQALGNIVSGFLISATKPYNLNDKIKVCNTSGSVMAEGLVADITTRHTIIKTFDGQSCIVPNSVMDESVIINTTYTDNVGNFLSVQIAYDADVDKAMELLKKIIIEHPLTLNDESMIIRLSSLEDSGVVLKTTVWSKDLDNNFEACSDIRCSILKEFRKAGIEIPYPTVSINNRQ